MDSSVDKQNQIKNLEMTTNLDKLVWQLQKCFVICIILVPSIALMYYMVQLYTVQLLQIDQKPMILRHLGLKSQSNDNTLKHWLLSWFASFLGHPKLV